MDLVLAGGAAEVAGRDGVYVESGVAGRDPGQRGGTKSVNKCGLGDGVLAVQLLFDDWHSMSVVRPW